MASTAALELLVELNDQASKGLDEIGEKGGGMGDMVKKGALIAGGAVLGLGAALGGAALAAADEEKGIKRLNTTLKNAIPNWDGNTDAIEANIAEKERLGFADDQLRDSLNLLVNQTGDLSEAQQLQTDAMNLARFGNIDLEKATRLLLKADDESYAALGKLGIQIDDNASKEDALRIIREKSAGQAEAYAATTAGSLERIQNSMGNVVEDIGGVVLGLVEGPLLAFADWFQSPEVQAGIQTIAKFIGETLKGAFDLLKQTIDVVMPIIQPFADAIINFVKGISSGGDFMTSLGTLFSDLGTAISNAWAIAAPALGTLLTNLGTWVMNDVLPKLPEWLGAIATAIWQFITDNGPTFLTNLATWTTAFFDWVMNDVLPQLPGWLGFIVEKVWEFITTNGPTILAKLAEWAGAFLGWVVKDVIPFLADELGKILTKVTEWIGEKAPVVLEKLGEWAAAFLAWVVDVENGLPPKLADLAQVIWNWITGVDTSLDQRTHELAVKFGEMPEDARQQLAQPTGLPAIWNEISNFLTGLSTDTATKIADEVAPNFWNWVTNAWTELSTKLGVFIDRMIEAIRLWGPDILRGAGEIGENIVSGIGTGINRGWTWLTNLVRQKVNELMAFAKGLLGIQSPSAVMAADLGEPMAAGIAVGFKRMFPTTLGIMLGTLSTTMTALDVWLMQNQPGIQGAGASMVDSLKEGWGHAFAALLTRIDADLMEARRRIAEGVTVGTTTVYNGSGGVPAGIGGGQWGLPGGSGGRNVLGATGAGGGGFSIGVVNVYASPGMNGRMVADEMIEELEYRLGDRIAIRNGTRAR